MTSYDIAYTPNGYGFGYDWTLVIKSGKKERRYWLGQDAKVAIRILGTDTSDLSKYVETNVGSRDFRKRKVRKFVAMLIIDAVVADESMTTEEKARAILKDADAWSLAVQ